MQQWSLARDVQISGVERVSAETWKDALPQELLPPRRITSDDIHRSDFWTCDIETLAYRYLDSKGKVTSVGTVDTLYNENCAYGIPQYGCTLEDEDEVEMRVMIFDDPRATHIEIYDAWTDGALGRLKL